MMLGRRISRRVLPVVIAAGSVFLTSLVGCSVEQSLPPPRCHNPGSGLIVAQSVPTASQVPCLLPLPDGWSVRSVSITQDRSIITLDSDRAGSGAAVVRFQASCDVSGAVSSPSELPGSERHDLIERLEPGFRAQRHYVFDGGCVSWDFDFDDGVSATEAVAIGDALLLISRRELNDGLRQTFIDREL